MALQEVAVKNIVPTLLILALLVSCSVNREGPESSAGLSVTGLQDINGIELPNLLTNSYPNNCTADAFSLPGQGYHLNGSGYHLNGSTRGFSVLQPGHKPPSLFDPQNITTAAQEGVELATIVPPSFTESTAIVVVDHFEGGFYELDAVMFDPAIQTNDDLGGALATLPPGRSLTHGAVVLNHINGLVAGTGHYSYLEAESSADKTVWEAHDTGARLYVVAVDTELQDTFYVSSVLSAELTNLSALGVDRAAVNMSFVVLPCDILEDFALAGFDTFETYVKALADANNVAPVDIENFVREVLESVNVPGNPDPLYNLMVESAFSATDYVYVAASGNFGETYALYPAAWGPVVSVTGSATLAPHVRADPFNAGEVMAIGATFELEDTLSSAKSLFHYLGTSFSAPAASVLSALDIATGSPRCLDGVSRSRLAHGNLTAFSLDKAYSKLCP